MKTKLIYQNEEFHEGYGEGEGTIERYEYECPCGNGRIIEEHDDIPGFKDHYVKILCNNCIDKYDLDFSDGIRNWKVIDKR